eukprot:TRINITY_DN2629_c0_g1_i1.p1 TRINITY_DN2629_c0_g1~~TRINITY_DN2629_c0_g1_i1.p1  ORF type:complete len:155 (-),score=24.61 TRINITY_DN2629_c0_g1_i1:58-465(-)
MDDPVSPSKSQNCAAGAVGGFISGSAVGALFGALMHGGQLKSAGLSGPMFWKTYGRMIGQTSLNFGVFLATYQSSYCVIEKTRDKKDFWNAAIAGGLAGGISSLGMRNVNKIATSAATTAALAAVLDAWSSGRGL